VNVLDRLRSLLARLLAPARLDTELDEELRSHVQLRADDLERSGLDRREAERRARIEFGGHLKFKEESRTAIGGTFWEALGQDLRFAARMLRKSRSFTAVAVVTLALTIGANTVVFATLNALILRPLNVPRPESLYSIHRINDKSGAVSYPDYIDLRDRNHSFEDLVGFKIAQVGLYTGDEPQRSWILSVTGNYFDALGIQPHLGRMLHASDEHGPNSAPYIVLSYAFWHARFHDDPGVVGRVVQVNKHPYTIVGVAPRGFNGTLLFFGPDFFAPIVQQEQLEGENDLDARGLRGSIFQSLGHLKPGVTPRQAADDINAISVDLQRTYPKEHEHLPVALWRPSLYGEFLGGPMRAFLTALMLLAALILLAACANLGSLFAARAADRSRELALRLALGAGRGRLLRQLFTEAVLVSLIGGTAGVVGSLVLLRGLSVWQPFPRFPLSVPLTPDASVYAVALLITLASGLIFGAVPVRQVLRTDPYGVIKAGLLRGEARRVSVRDVLLVAQIAICALLVTSSIVAVRGLSRSLHGDFGFDPRGAILAEMQLETAGYRGDAVPAMQRRMVDAMESIPGVSAVGIVDWVPLTTGDYNGTFVFKDDAVDLKRANSVDKPALFRVSPGYVSAAGITVLAGRDLSWHDDEHAPHVALVNQAFAKKVFGSETAALGRFFKQRDGTRTQVVGVVRDGRYQSLTEEQLTAIYRPLLQSQSSELSLVVRTSGDPEALAGAIRARLRGLDPGLPTFIQSWPRAMELVMFPSRVAAVALGLLGAMAALLSITGIFGLAAYSVSRRLKELGIRIALGAERHEVLRATLARPLALLAYGSVAGLLLGILASRVLAVIVYQATPRDPQVLAGVVLVMLLLGLVATWIPARRALAADPLVLLREE
jgi:predicted permease